MRHALRRKPAILVGFALLATLALAPQVPPKPIEPPKPQDPAAPKAAGIDLTLEEQARANAAVESFAALLKQTPRGEVKPRTITELAQRRLELASKLKDCATRELIAPPSKADINAAGDGGPSKFPRVINELNVWFEQEMNAKLDLARNPRERIQAISDQVLALRRTETLFREYAKLPERTGVSGVDADRLEFDSLVLESRLAKELGTQGAPVAKPPANDDNATARERVNVAKQALEVLQAQVTSGTIHSGDARFFTWRLRLANAYRDQGDKAARMAALESLVTGAKAAEEAAKALHASGRGQVIDALEARNSRLEAEEMLAKAKAEKN